MAAAEEAGVEHAVSTSLSGDGDHLPCAARAPPDGTAASRIRELDVIAPN
ncbi:hypothetical protein [Kitasatospora sp. NPDC057936]